MTRAKTKIVRESIVRASALVKSRLEAKGDEKGTVTDILTELRHYCQASKIDFYKALDASCDIYAEERRLG